MDKSSNVMTDERIQEVQRLVNELVGRHETEVSSDNMGMDDVLDEVVSGLRALTEVDILRQLPLSRFQELLSAAISKEWYEGALGAISESLIVIGRSGMVQFVNPATLDLLGYQEDDLVGQSFDIVTPEGGPRSDELLETADSNSANWNQVQTRYRTSSGLIIPVSFSCSPMRDEDDNLRAVVCVARDIRARLKTTEALRDSEERYELAARGANDGLWEWSSSTKTNYYSPRFGELLGYDSEPPSGDLKLIDDLVHPEDQQRVGDAIAGHSKEEQPFDIECRLKRRDSDYRHFNLRGLAVWNEQGEPRRIVGSLRDITERKQFEDLRNRFIERVISAEDAERRRIARELHDETSQSLTSLLVGLKAIEFIIDSEEVRERVNHLRKLTGQTLEEVGRLARGLHPSILDDLGFATAIERYAAEYSKSHNCQVDVHIQGIDSQHRLPLVVETTLYRILQEALTNVAKHAGAHTASIVVSRQDDKVRAIIEDDGRGFDLEDQGGAGVLDVSSGLGLHGIRERAALLKGLVTVESTPGVGTTLYVQIPIEIDGL